MMFKFFWFVFIVIFSIFIVLDFFAINDLHGDIRDAKAVCEKNNLKYDSNLVPKKLQRDGGARCVDSDLKSVCYTYDGEPLSC
ncbi:MAG: hypothetical protein AABX08_03850 [Nanoarchaeota archaeon]